MNSHHAKIYACPVFDCGRHIFLDSICSCTCIRVSLPLFNHIYVTLYRAIKHLSHYQSISPHFWWYQIWENHLNQIRLKMCHYKLTLNDIFHPKLLQRHNKAMYNMMMCNHHRQSKRYQYCQTSLIWTRKEQPVFHKRCPYYRGKEILYDVKVSLRA